MEDRGGEGAITEVMNARKWEILPHFGHFAHYALFFVCILRLSEQYIIEYCSTYELYRTNILCFFWRFLRVLQDAFKDIRGM